MSEMKNVYGDNVSWFCLEGSVTLEESRFKGSFSIDDEFEVYGEDSFGNEGTVNVDVIKLLESAHICIDDKDKKIDRMVEEIAELKEVLESLVECASINEERLNDLLMCGDYGESKELCDAKQLLNQEGWGE